MWRRKKLKFLRGKGGKGKSGGKETVRGRVEKIDNEDKKGKILL